MRGVGVGLEPGNVGFCSTAHPTNTAHDSTTKTIRLNTPNLLIALL
jgi:hypothetical protein